MASYLIICTNQNLTPKAWFNRAGSVRNMNNQQIIQDRDCVDTNQFKQDINPHPQPSSSSMNALKPRRMVTGTAQTTKPEVMM